MRRGTLGFLLPHMLDTLEASEGADTFAALATVHDLLCEPRDSLRRQLDAQFDGLTGEQRNIVTNGCYARGRRGTNANERFLVAQITGVIGLQEVRACMCIT